MATPPCPPAPATLSKADPDGAAEDSRSLSTYSSSSSSFADFTFPMERLMVPEMFPYYASAGGSVFPPPSSCAADETITLASVVPEDQQKAASPLTQAGCCTIHPEIDPALEKVRCKTIGSSCRKCCDEWHALQMEKARMEVELLQKQLAQYHPEKEMVVVPSDNFRKTKDWLEQPQQEEENSNLDTPILEEISDVEFKRQLRGLQVNPYPARVLNICHQWRWQCERSQTFCQKVVLSEGIEALLDAMILQKDYPEVQEAISRVLGLLVFDSDSHKEWLAETDGIAAILGAMKRFADDPDVQEAACGALHSFVYNHEPSQALVAQAGGVPLLLAAMKRHRSDPGVQELGCAALTNLACHSNVAILKSIVHAGGLDVVVTAMKEHSGDEGVQEAACAALSNLIYHDKPLPAGGIFATPQIYEIQAVITAMNLHSSNVGIQEQACRALLAMAYHHDANKTAMAEFGAPMAICHAMKQHSSDALLVETASDALCSLSHNQDLNKTLIAEADGIFTILSVMANHISNVEVIQSCCKCLSHLTTHHQDNQQLLALSGGIPIILDALNINGARHYASSVLRTLLCHPESRQAFSNVQGLRTFLQASTTTKHPSSLGRKQTSSLLPEFACDSGSSQLNEPKQWACWLQPTGGPGTLQNNHSPDWDGIPQEIEFFATRVSDTHHDNLLHHHQPHLVLAS